MNRIDQPHNTFGHFFAFGKLLKYPLWSKAVFKINCATSFDCVSLMCTLLRQVTLLTPNTVFAGCFLASQVAMASTGEQQRLLSPGECAG